MKKVNIVLIIVISMSLLVIGCSGKSANKETQKLSRYEKMNNLYVNIILMNSVQFPVALSKGGSDLAKLINQTYNDGEENLLKNSKVKKKLNAFYSEDLEAEMEDQISHFYEEINKYTKDNYAKYKKAYSDELIEEGISIAETEEIPHGFKPLTQKLSSKELIKYTIFYLALDDNEKAVNDYYVVKTFNALKEWVKKGEKLE